MIKTMMFVPVDKPPQGVCTLCGGILNGYLRLQHCAGEVREIVCPRCQGTTKEPVGFWAKLKATFRPVVYP